MKQLATNLAVAITIASFLLLVTLVIRSYYVGDLLTVTENIFAENRMVSQDWGIVTSRGRLLFSMSRSAYSLNDARTKEHFHSEYPAGLHLARKTQLPEDTIDLGWDQTPWRRLGFIAIRHVSRTTEASRTRVGAPLWLFAFTFALPITFRVIRDLRRWRRLRHGHCPACGYDLRVTPDRCPECAWTPHLLTGGDFFRRLLPLTGAITILLAAAVIAVPGPPPKSTPSARNPTREIGSASAPTLASSTRPTISLSDASLPQGSRWKGLPPFNASHPVPDRIRQMAASVDPTKVYIFLYISPSARPSLAKKQMACVQVFARRARRWRSEFLYLKAGQAVGNNDYPTSLKIAEIRQADNDLLVTFVDTNGKTITRSGIADLHDPVREFLRDMNSNIGAAWEDQLFPP